MTKKKAFSPEQKSLILKQHLKKKVPISEICQQNECTPGAVYQWQEVLFSRAHIVFERNGKKIGRPKKEIDSEKKLKTLEDKLVVKNEVISELMEELLREKKLNGAI